MGTDQWSGIEVRHLAALEALARAGSFRKAALRLGYVASSVSQQIAALERIVGQRVAERSRGGGPVSLTPAGELVLAHAEAILGRLRAAEADIAALAQGGAALLRVGITESVGVRVLPELVRRFGSEWPQVRLRPSEASADLELYAGVERGELDLSFVELPAPPGPFETRELLTDRYVIVLASDSPLARGPLELGDLAQTPLVGHTHCRGIPPRRLAIVRHRERSHSPPAASFIEAAVGVCVAIARRPAPAAMPA